MNIEEKAKRYVLDKLEENGYRNFHGGECVEDAFTAGYTQAVTDLSAENEKLKIESQNYADLFRASQEVVNQYKEALSLAYDLIVASTEYEVEIVRYREGLLKINELLKPSN